MARKDEAPMSADDRILAILESLAGAKAPSSNDDRIAAVLEQLLQQAPPEVIGLDHPKFQERLEAEGFNQAFTVPVYQNGKPAQARGLKPETVEHAAQLKPGKYVGGKVEVIHDNKGRIHLFYGGSKVEDRMRVQEWLRGDFNDLIAMIWAEQGSLVAA